MRVIRPGALSAAIGLLALAIAATASADKIKGTADNDTLIGTADDDHIIGQAGDDFLLGAAGNDLLIGGPGSDILRGLNGDDDYIGGDGDDLIQTIVTLVLPFMPTFAQCMSQPLEEWDVSGGGDGDDIIQWASGPVSLNLPLPSPPSPWCASAGSGEANGGDGFDVVRIGIGSFDGHSASYVIEDATEPGYTWQIRSLVTGAVLNIKNIEEIHFSDAVVEL